jgi:hypothetical protein
MYCSVCGQKYMFSLINLFSFLLLLILVLILVLLLIFLIISLIIAHTSNILVTSDMEPKKMSSRYWHINITTFRKPTPCTVVK